MSEVGWKRASGEVQLKPEQLEETKLGIVKFASSGILGDQLIVPHLIIAAADTRFSVANAADSALKRVGGYFHFYNCRTWYIYYCYFFPSEP